MNKRYKVCPLFWSDYVDERTLMNMGVFEELLNEGWQILRVDTMPPTELRNSYRRRPASEMLYAMIEANGKRTN